MSDTNLGVACPRNLTLLRPWVKVTWARGAGENVPQERAKAGVNVAWARAGGGAGVNLRVFSLVNSTTMVGRPTKGLTVLERKDANMPNRPTDQPL